MEKFFNLYETSRILGIPLRTLRAWIKDGTVKAFKFPNKKRWFVTESEINDVQARAKGGN